MEGTEILEMGLYQLVVECNQLNCRNYMENTMPIGVPVIHSIPCPSTLLVNFEA
jgi:hypothetical protein